MAPNQITWWVQRHPWRWAVVSAALVALFGFGLWQADGLPFVLPSAALVGLANGIVWRPEGPGVRWASKWRENDPPA